MKKILLLLLFCQFLIPQRTKTDWHTYSKDVIFTIEKITHTKIAEYGNAGSHMYIAKKGMHFRGAWIDFTNKSSEDVIIDFEQIFLLDSKGQKYPVHRVSQDLKLTGTSQKYKMKLKAGKTRRFNVGFWPAIEKSDNENIIMINGQSISYSYL